VTGRAYQENGQTPSVRGGGGQRPACSGARWATISGEKSGKGDMLRDGVWESQNTPSECADVYGGGGGVGDMGGEAC
jgi:hypothetical protein